MQISSTVRKAPVLMWATQDLILVIGVYILLYHVPFIHDVLVLQEGLAGVCSKILGSWRQLTPSYCTSKASQSFIRLQHF
jgi:hypothetical protein